MRCLTVKLPQSALPVLDLELLPCHCSVLGDKALRAAIDDYLEKNGLDNPYKKSIAKIICECKGVTDQMIEHLVATDQAKTLEDLQRLTGYGTGCGRCKARIEHEFEEMKHIHGK